MLAGFAGAINGVWLLPGRSSNPRGAETCRFFRNQVHLAVLYRSQRHFPLFLVANIS